MSVASQMHCHFNADFIPETGESQLETSQESMGDASVFSHCSLLRNPSPKPTGVLEHCSSGETQPLVLIFSRRFHLAASQRRRKMSLYISLFTVAIHVNYSRDFRERFEATMYFTERQKGKST
jgi:hypothetical protein